MRTNSYQTPSICWRMLEHEAETNRDMQHGEGSWENEEKEEVRRKHGQRRYEKKEKQEREFSVRKTPFMGVQHQLSALTWTFLKLL